ncbi:MAG: hypothetical protein ACPLKP_02555 [Microgenomates group bacterium]
MKKINLLIIFLQLGIIIFSWQNLPPQIPLFYSLPWGKERLSSSLSLFILPIFSLGIFLINCLIIPLLIKKTEEKFALDILEGGSLSFSILTFISLAKIILLVT